MSAFDRITEQIASLEAFTKAAAESAEKGKDARSAVSACNTFSKAFGALLGTDEGKLALGSVAQSVEVALAQCERITASLAVSSGADRSEGDKLARGLSQACEMGWLEGDERDHVEEIVSAWNATAPKGSTRSSGSSGSGEAKRDLPFPVKITCESHEWSATQSTTKNSLKWAAVQHHAKEHGHKFGRGDATNAGVVEAINSVVEGRSTHAQGGGYLVDKA